MKYSHSWAFPDDNLHFKGNYWPIILALRILEQKCWLRLVWVWRESVRECERACSRLGLDPPLISKSVWIPSRQRPGFPLDLSWGPETAASLIDRKKGFVSGTQTQTRVALAQPFRWPPVQGWWRLPPRPGTQALNYGSFSALLCTDLASQSEDCTAVSVASHPSVSLALSHCWIKIHFQGRDQKRSYNLKMVMWLG